MGYILGKRDDMQLRLSQSLIIQNYCTISVSGETESYYMTSKPTGECDWLPQSEVWYALTDKAKEIWKGKTKEVGGVTLGKLFVMAENQRN